MQQTVFRRELIRMLKNLCPALVPGGASLHFEQAVNLAGDAGYDSIELSIEEVVRLTEQKSLNFVGDRLSEAGLVPGGWQVVYEGKDAWRADDLTYQRSLAALPHYADVARRLDCTRAFTWLPSYSDERDFDANFAWHVERLKPIARVLTDYGCTLGLEWQGPKTLRTGHAFESIHTQ
jgi:sugar phosphate isomerase/epimerase